VRELTLLARARVLVCLGAFAWSAALRLVAELDGAAAPPPRPLPRFAHAGEWRGDRRVLIGCYHPSQQNTFTGKLTEPMIDAVLLRARAVAQERLQAR
jgi:uracil-DNA glycosylase